MTTNQTKLSIKIYAMKRNPLSGNYAFSTIQSGVVSFKLQPLYLSEKAY
jgi:hypothetical protein